MTVPILPKPELRELARIMDRMLALPVAEVQDKDAVKALLKRGLVVLGINGWRANEEGARAYLATICVEAGKPNPFAPPIAAAS